MFKKLRRNIIKFVEGFDKRAHTDSEAEIGDRDRSLTVWLKNFRRTTLC